MKQKQTKVTEPSLRDMRHMLDAIQMFQDHQVTTRDMSVHLTGLRSGSAASVVQYLETIVPEGELTNITTRHMLHVVHPYLVGACQQALGLGCPAKLPEAEDFGPPHSSRCVRFASSPHI